MTELDLKNRKILHELDTNSRQSYCAIARKVGLSKDSVIYRIRKLQQSGIIKQFHTVLDVGKLGYISFRLYLKFQNTTPEKEQEIIDFIRKIDCVTWLVSIEGDFDLGMWILVKSISKMNELWKTLLAKYRDNIERRQLTIFTRVSYFPRAYLLGKKHNFEECVFITEPAETEITPTDTKILALLAPNSRIPSLDIARTLRITPKTAASRIKQLEKKKIIVGYRTMFDLEKIGYQYFKVHFNLHNVTPDKERRFRAFILQHPNIIFDNEVLGGDDIEIEIQVKTLSELRTILDDIKKTFSEIIRNYRYMRFYKEHKFLFFPA